MKGFTLIEVMISLFILLAGMSGVIKLQVTSAAMTKLSGDLTYAQNLAQTALQTQLSRPVDDVTAAGATCLLAKPDSATSSADSIDVDFKGITYKVTCSITKNKASMLGDKYIGTDNTPVGFVDITVTWSDLLGNNDSNKHTIHSYGIVISK